MFTVGAFSIFFWTLAGVIVLMLIFEDKLIALEDEYDKRKAEKKTAQQNFQKRTAPRQAELRRIEVRKTTCQKRETGKRYAA